MAGMDYITWVILKFLGLVFLAFVWGIFCGFTGRNLRGEPHDK